MKTTPNKTIAPPPKIHGFQLLFHILSMVLASFSQKNHEKPRTFSLQVVPNPPAGAWTRPRPTPARPGARPPAPLGDPRLVGAGRCGKRGEVRLLLQKRTLPAQCFRFFLFFRISQPMDLQQLGINGQGSQLGITTC